jgi:lipopolysaccharide export system protein LptC
MNPRITAAIGVLVVAAIVSWYIAREDDVIATNQEGDGAYLGYYLTDARILGTDEDGTLLYEIRADRAEQQRDDSIVFSDVKIEYSPATDVPWTISAESAAIYPAEKRIFLEGNVLATSSEGFSGEETELRTPSLELDPARYVAETDERIEILIGERSLNGTGMLASLDENRLEIKSNVSGRFIP